MASFLGSRWLLVPLALVVGAAGGASAVRWKDARDRDPRPKSQTIPKPPGRRDPPPPHPDLAEFGPDLSPLPGSPLEPGMSSDPVAAATPDPEPNPLPPMPTDLFRLPVADPKDGPVPPPVQVGQTLVIEVLEALPGRPITGTRVVRPDGTVSLGFYGNLRVAGLDRDQIKVRLLEYLRNTLTDEVLGLTRTRLDTGVTEWTPPLESRRVFVDDAPGFPTNAPPTGPDALAAVMERLDALEREIKAARAPQVEPTPTPPADPK